MEFSSAAVPAKFFFQFVFCAVSLAIVWGTTIERIKFGAYLIYAVVFSALIYPVISHWIFGGGWLQAELRHAGLRRLDGRAPDRRHRRPRGAAAARPAPRQVRRGRQAERDPRPQHAARGPGRADPVVRLVRLQRGLDARRDRPALRRRGGGHPARRRDGRARRDGHQLPDHEEVRHRHERQRRDRRPRRDHGAVGLRGVLGRADHRPRGRRHRGRRDHRDRPQAGRPGGRPLGPRHRGHLGHARLRPLHEPAAGGAERDRRRRAVLHGLVRASSACRRWAWRPPSPRCSR